MATFVLVHGGWQGGWCWQHYSRTSFEQEGQKRDTSHPFLPVTSSVIEIVEQYTLASLL